MTDFRRTKSLVIITVIVTICLYVIYNKKSLIGQYSKGRFPVYQLVRSDIYKYLKPPSPYRLTKNIDTKYSQSHQDVTVYSILPIDAGFFIEMGAFDGATLSNTLWLERKHNWTGLLIEANPDLCRQIDSKKRVAWRLCACISNKSDVNFKKGAGLGGISDTLNERVGKDLGKRTIKVPCFPFLDALTAINRFVIDYFSLDVEGGEMEFLVHIKSDLISQRIIVKVWTIEYRIFDGHKNLIPESLVKLNQLRSFFKEVGGYKEHSQLGSRRKEDGYSLDVVFVRSDVNTNQ